MQVRECPRCGEPLPVTAYWEPLTPVPGHAPAQRLRHKRANGSTCILYAGPPRESDESGAETD